jgi:hypothetical protein
MLAEIIQVKLQELRSPTLKAKLNSEERTEIEKEFHKFSNIYDFENKGLSLGSYAIPKLGIYQVNVVKRSNTKEIVWSGEVEATSGKNAQEKWRKEYADVRSKYNHSYALLIKRVASL